MPAMPSQSNIHLDILEGRDETLDVTDFFRMSLFLDMYPPNSVFTTDFQIPMATLPWTYMRIWNESCGCDAIGSLMRLVLPSTQLDGRLHDPAPDDRHSGEEVAAAQSCAMYSTLVPRLCNQQSYWCSIQYLRTVNWHG